MTSSSELTPANFAAAFTVTSGNLAGDAVLRIRTNADTGALEPSVAPPATRIVGAGGEDPLVAPGGQSAAIALAGPDIAWFDFQTCVDASATEFVTVSGAGTDSFSYSMVLFNSAGNMVNSGAGSETEPVIMEMTDLPAGHYFIAMGYDPVMDLSPLAATDGRFHVRSHNQSNGFNFQLNVQVMNPSCGPVCGTSDFNGDGAFGQDDDIEAFFLCLGGNCCDTCWPAGSDFNGDGAAGQDNDIESFFLVLGGSNCV